MAVRIVQLLCPRRHCIIAGAYEEGSGTSAHTTRALMEMMTALSIEERCALCNSTDLKFEDALTKYASLGEARAALEATERRILESRAVIERHRSNPK